MHKFGKAGIVLSLCALSGCNFLQAIEFSQNIDPNSGSKIEQETRLYTLYDTRRYPSRRVNGQNIYYSVWKSFGRKARDKVNECLHLKVEEGTQAAPLAVLIAPLVGYAVGQGISFVQSELSSWVKKLQERGQRTYGARLILNSPTDFSRANCLLIIRGKFEKTGKGIKLDSGGLITILKLEYGNISREAFTIVPVYLKLLNAIAITRNGEPIELDIGFVGLAARTVPAGPDQGVRKMEVFAQASLKLRRVRIGKDIVSLGDGSGLLPTFPTAASAIQLNIAVVESGSGIPDGKKAAAEIEALFKALGPTLQKEAQKLIPAQ